MLVFSCVVNSYVPQASLKTMILREDGGYHGEEFECTFMCIVSWPETASLCWLLWRKLITMLMIVVASHLSINVLALGGGEAICDKFQGRSKKLAVIYCVGLSTPRKGEAC